MPTSVNLCDGAINLREKNGSRTIMNASAKLNECDTKQHDGKGRCQRSEETEAWCAHVRVKRPNKYSTAL